jgi:hypothetical protein
VHPAPQGWGIGCEYLNREPVSWGLRAWNIPPREHREIGSPGHLTLKKAAHVVPPPDPAS